MSISKYELFASLDDDNSIDGYSLQSRGLYPRREIRKVALKSKKSFLIRCIILFIPKKVLNILKRITYHF